MGIHGHGGVSLDERLALPGRGSLEPATSCGRSRCDDAHGAPAHTPDKLSPTARLQSFPLRHLAAGHAPGSTSKHQQAPASPVTARRQPPEAGGLPPGPGTSLARRLASSPGVARMSVSTKPASMSRLACAMTGSGAVAVAPVDWSRSCGSGSAAPSVSGAEAGTAEVLVTRAGIGSCLPTDGRTFGLSVVIDVLRGVRLSSRG